MGFTINKTFVAIGLVVLLGAGGAGWYYYQTQQTKTTAVQETATVTRGKITSTVAATGTVKPFDAVDISAQVSALVKEIKVKENDYVTAGQVLAVLDDKSLETTLNKARYNLNNTASTYQRLSYLHSIGAKSDSDLEAALLDYQTAQASYSEAQSNVEKTTLLSPMAGIVLGDPVSVGTLVTAGVNNPTVIMMIGDVSRKIVKVKVDETDIGQVKVGQSATFTVDAFPNQTFTATVSKIGQLSTSTSTISPSSSSSTSSSTSSSSSSSNSVVYYYVTLNVDDPDNLLKVDMTARVNIKIGEKDKALLIPLSALKTNTGGQHVSVLRGGKTENVTVTTGLTNNENVEILSGLQEGDKLVISYTKSQTSASSSSKRDGGPPPM